MKSRIRKSPTSNFKWFIPGMGVKRWLILFALGSALLGLGVVYLIVVLYRNNIIPLTVYRILTLQFLPAVARVALAVTIGALISFFSIFYLSRSVFAPFLETRGARLADALYAYRRRKRGPHIVAIGGGTGLSKLLRGIKHQTNQITAIITVADDGGSSGRIRRELGLLPPGDFRNCIAALADDEALTTQLFQYRFGFGTDDHSLTNGELSGHSFGNLFIAAMTGITGSFEHGLEQSSRVLAIQGRILPSTLADVTLVADVREQRVRRVAGESHIPKANGEIERVFLVPENVPAYPAAIRAILTADLIVLGPGSLFTSVLPNLLVKGIREALESTRATVLYICNVACQRGETDNFDTGNHLAALERHIGKGIIDVMMVNNTVSPQANNQEIAYVSLGKKRDIRIIELDLIDEQNPRQHDSDKLARAIMSLRLANSSDFY